MKRHRLKILGLWAILSLTILPGCATTNTKPAPAEHKSSSRFWEPNTANLFGHASGSDWTAVFRDTRTSSICGSISNRVSRVRLVFFEITTGKFVRSAPWFQASTFFYEYETLFFIDFHVTSLIGPLENQTSGGTNEGTATDV